MSKLFYPINLILTFIDKRKKNEITNIVPYNITQKT